MKRKIFSILFALVLVCSFSLVTAVPASAAVLIVGPAQYTTIQEAINDAASGDIITVEGGPYAENIDINKALTLQGIGDSRPIIQGLGGTVVTISADGVVIDGFVITNPSGKCGIYAKDRSNITITNNTVTGIGSSDVTASGTNQGIAIVSSADGVGNIIIVGNDISTIVGGNFKSADGIVIGHTDGVEAVTGLLIQSNVIFNITSATVDFASGGRGAYGILLSHGTAGGQTVGAQVLDNIITDLEGLWAHGIGLEGNTPGALVSGNSISYLYDHKTPSDAVAVQVEDNLGATTVTIEFNNFDNVNVGVQNVVSGALVTAENNWWGSASGPTHDSNTYTNPAGDLQGSAVSDWVDFVPWLGGPYPSVTSIAPVYLDTPPGQFSSIQGAINAATHTTITCVAGTYTENVTITTSNLQLLGAKAGVPAGPDADPDNRGADESVIEGSIQDGGGVSGSTIDGFTILSGAQHAITIVGGDTVVNNIMEPSGGPTTSFSGIWSGGSGGHFIANNNISDYERGMMFDGNIVPPITVTENYITGSSSTGIIMMGSLCSGHTITNNLIEENSSGMVFAQGGHQVSGNRILNNDGSGIYIYGTPNTYGIQITHNLIAGNGWSIYLDNDDSGAINNVAHFNNIVDNGGGLYNGHSAAFDATFNWWGDVTGPEQATTNPDGKGDKVSDNVYYIPWLTRHFETVLTEGIGYYGYPMVELGTGWNLLSTPFALDPGETIGEVDYPGCNTWAQFVTLNELPLYTGEEPEYVNAYYFDGDVQDWGEVGDGYELLPCDAIYVRMASPDIAAVLASPQRWMPTKTLYEDWNLVGLSWMTPGGQDVPAKLALKTVEEVGSLTGYTLVVSPWANQQPWTYIAGMDVPRLMQLTKGYWVFMENGPDDLAGSWFTPMGLP